MSAVKVQFTRVENEAEVNNTQIKDGQLLYTRDGKLYMDYGTARKKLTSLIELLTVDSTAPSECSTGDMYYNTTTSLIYTAIGTDTWSSTGTTPSTKYLYVDLTNAKLYYYDGVTFTSYGGGSVDADTQMSDSSTNPVQNKVIKQYVDTEISSIPEEVIISDTQPSGNNWKIWIDSDEVGSQTSEITNEYSTSIGLGYSANYINNMNTYSTTDEIRIGTWINNKPLYRKVINFGSLPNATTKDVAHNISNIGQVIKIEGVAFTSNDYQPMPLVYANASNYNTTLKVNATNISIITNENRTNYSAYIILEYTKTTD